LLEIQRLSDQTLEMGKELGRFEATIEANQWLQALLALVRGDGGVSAVDVRVIGLTVLRGCKAWFQQNQGQTSLTLRVMPMMDSTIRELEQWKV
jgi:hypothetical protein